MRTISILTILCAVALTACLIDTRKPAPAETTSESCGNGTLEPGEECDQGALNSDTGACLSSCRLATCGDGHTYAEFEQCDDGNRITEECEYGLPSCTVCDANCQEMPGKTAFCGDGITDTQEMCDDGNLTCGTCNSECQDLAWSAATGYIYVVNGFELESDLTDEFTLNDGFHAVTFTFKVVDNPIRVPQAPAMSLNGSHIVITVHKGWSKQQVADEVIDIINHPSSPLLISADTYCCGRVDLTHSMPGLIGYQDIVENVAANSFRVEGMSGEAGYDCAIGERCSSDEDCESYYCPEIAGICWFGGEW